MIKLLAWNRPKRKETKGSRGRSPMWALLGSDWGAETDVEEIIEKTQMSQSLNQHIRTQHKGFTNGLRMIFHRVDLIYWLCKVFTWTLGTQWHSQSLQHQVYLLHIQYTTVYEGHSLCKMICAPYWGCRVMIARGACMYEGESSKLKRCRIIAKHSLASSMAKFCPIQMRGPNPKGK